MPDVQWERRAMTFDPSGGVQAVQVPFKPPVALAEGMIVTFPVDGVPVYAEFVRERMERRHGQWLIFAYVRPIPTGQLLSGWGELATDIRELEVVG
jgi:hypothetical protein